jgi:hypothetical protein
MWVQARLCRAVLNRRGSRRCWQLATAWGLLSQVWHVPWNRQQQRERVVLVSHNGGCCQDCKAVLIWRWACCTLVLAYWRMHLVTHVVCCYSTLYAGAGQCTGPAGQLHAAAAVRHSCTPADWPAAAQPAADSGEAALLSGHLLHPIELQVSYAMRSMTISPQCASSTAVNPCS